MTLTLAFQSQFQVATLKPQHPKTSSSDTSVSTSSKYQNIVTPNFSRLSSQNSFAEESVLVVVGDPVCESDSSLCPVGDSHLPVTGPGIPQNVPPSLAELIVDQQSPDIDPGIPQNVPTSYDERRGDQEPPETAKDEWYGMKFDIDKTVKTRYMRVDKRNTSMQLYHVYAVRVRVNLTLSSEVAPPVPDAPNLESLLPSRIDHSTLSSHFATHISRILTTYTCPSFVKTLEMLSIIIHEQEITGSKFLTLIYNVTHVNVC